MGEPENLTLEMGWRLAPTALYVRFVSSKRSNIKTEMIKGSLREETWDIQVKKDSFVPKYLLKCESTLHPVQYKYKKAKFNDCEVIQKIGKEQ